MISPMKIELETDYAAKYGIVETQTRLKNMLIKIDEVCRDNDIEYSIAYGTLIGAVRHKGFIPWDDDIDIVMKRQEFEKFKEAVASTDNMEIIYWLWVERVIEKGSPANLFIDIMILDDCPSNKSLQKIKALLCRMLQGTLKETLNWSKYSMKNKILLATTGLMGKLIGKKRCLKTYQKVEKMGNGKNSEYVSAYNGSFVDAGHKYKKEWFDKYVDIQFEDITVRCVECAHECLQTYYGDYMVLPPEEKRIPEHGRID